MITCGCGGALEFCFTVLGNPGQNILVPRPNIPLQFIAANGRGINIKYYRLLVRRIVYCIYSVSKCIIDICYNAGLYLKLSCHV